MFKEYTVNDLAFWGGLILGTSGTYVILTNLPAYHDVLNQMGAQDFARIITLVIAVIVGAALGAATERTLRSYQADRAKAKQAQGDNPDDYSKDYHEERDEHDPRR